jgi:hypothetical protein
MGKKACAFKQSDMVRAVKAAQAAGLKKYHVGVGDNGKPLIIVGSEVDKLKVQTLGSWDSVIADLESR